MNLYLITQDEEHGYDTYDSAVVCAEDELTARNIHPGSGKTLQESPNWSRTWCKTANLVQAHYLGVAAPDVKAGVVLASFNAG